ncbi:hypothetical protein LguiB_027074 [Lonicera macranthoides]
MVRGIPRLLISQVENHRRLVSNLIAFDDERSNRTMLIRNNGFEGFDDEQLSSIFSDDASVTLLSCLTDPSTPLDQSSDNEEKVTPPEHHWPQQPKHEPGEVRTVDFSLQVEYGAWKEHFRIEQSQQLLQGQQ